MNSVLTKRILFSALAVLLLSGAALTFCIFSPFSHQKGNAYLYIDRDDNIDSVYNKVKVSASPAKMIGLRFCGLVMNYADHLYSGKYEIGNAQSAYQVMRRIRGGQQTPVKLVIPIVHTLGDLSARLSDFLAADSTSLMSAFLNPENLADLHTDSANVICHFIPNTYEVYWNITPEKLLKRMKREHDAFWNDSRKKKAADMGLTTDEVYALASIVQQESGNAQERPTIAGMYMNRLRKRMPLQADPTVKFALQNFSLRRIFHKHLEFDSPYNTYKYQGLPVGPICIPSLNAIESVLNYARHDYLYMCAKEDFSGTHNFSSSFKEHQNNARKYARALNERKIYK